MRRSLVMVVALVSACAARPPAAAPEREPGPEPRLAAVDVFDTDRRSVERVLELHGDELAALVHDEDSVDFAALMAGIKASGDYAYVEPALIGYDDGAGLAYYLTIDLVGASDVAHRMPFTASPTEDLADPGGLIAAWHTFDAKAHELVAAGELRAGRAECPAFHCLVDHSHAALAPLARPMIEGVPAHVDALAAVLTGDRDVADRAAAAFLVAYARDGARVVEALVPAFRDNELLVRNNAMRVVAEMARHSEVEVPVEPVLEALAYAATTDRNKAAAILDGLLQRPGAERLHARVAREAGATLLAMLRLQQPNNHDFAYSILKAISGKDLGERAYDAWEAWLEEAGRNN